MGGFRGFKKFGRWCWRLRRSFYRMILTPYRGSHDLDPGPDLVPDLDPNPDPDLDPNPDPDPNPNPDPDLDRASPPIYISLSL